MYENYSGPTKPQNVEESKGPSQVQEDMKVVSDLKTDVPSKISTYNGAETAAYNWSQNIQGVDV